MSSFPATRATACEKRRPFYLVRGDSASIEHRPPRPGRAVGFDPLVHRALGERPRAGGWPCRRQPRAAGSAVHARTIEATLSGRARYSSGPAPRAYSATLSSRSNERGADPGGSRGHRPRGRREVGPDDVAFLVGNVVGPDRLQCPPGHGGCRADRSCGRQTGRPAAGSDTRASSARARHGLPVRRRGARCGRRRRASPTVCRCAAE